MLHTCTRDSSWTTFKPDPHTQASEPRMSSGDENAIVNDQPKPSIPMTPGNAQSSGGGDRNGLKVPLNDDRSRVWSYDLFDCFSDRRTCALASCCCCYVYSRNKRRLDHLERHGTPLREPVERYNSDCRSYFWLQFFLCSGWILSVITRSDVRRRYGIRGEPIDDVLVNGCCYPCELVQEHREIQVEESTFYHMY